jgi:hypothetical protein
MREKTGVKNALDFLNPAKFVTLYFQIPAIGALQNLHFDATIWFETMLNPFLSTTVFLHFGQTVFSACRPGALPI